MAIGFLTSKDRKVDFVFDSKFHKRAHAEDPSSRKLSETAIRPLGEHNGPMRTERSPTPVALWQWPSVSLLVAPRLGALWALEAQMLRASLHVSAAPLLGHDGPPQISKLSVDNLHSSAAEPIR